MSMWDDEAGYDRDDPKHPDWADAMADRADMARKREKEERDEDEYQLHHPTGPLGPKTTNLQTLTRACHSGSHDLCNSHMAGGDHSCQCRCHGA